MRGALPPFLEENTMIRVQSGGNSPVTIPGATRMDVDEHGLLTLRDDDGKAVAYYRDWSSVAVVDPTPATELAASAVEEA